MGDDGQAGLLRGFAERLHLVGFEGLGSPAAGVLGEDLQALGAVGLRTLEGLGRASGDGLVSTEEHGISGCRL